MPSTYIMEQEKQLEGCYRLRRCGQPATLPGVADIFKITRPTTTVGRNRNAVDFFLASSKRDFISRLHAEILCFTDDFYGMKSIRCALVDKNSTNGTFVNYVKIGDIPVALDEGDIITFGHAQGCRLKEGERIYNTLSEFCFVFEKIHDIPDTRGNQSLLKEFTMSPTGCNPLQPLSVVNRFAHNVNLLEQTNNAKEDNDKENSSRSPSVILLDSDDDLDICIQEPRSQESVVDVSSHASLELPAVEWAPQAPSNKVPDPPAISSPPTSDNEAPDSTSNPPPTADDEFPDSTGSPLLVADADSEVSEVVGGPPSDGVPEVVSGLPAVPSSKVPEAASVPEASSGIVETCCSLDCMDTTLTCQEDTTPNHPDKGPGDARSGRGETEASRGLPCQAGPGDARAEDQKGTEVTDSLSCPEAGNGLPSTSCASHQREMEKIPSLKLTRCCRKRKRAEAKWNRMKKRGQGKGKKAWKARKLEICEKKEECKQPKGFNIPWVRCNDCKGWYHTYCVGVDYNQIKQKNIKFHCGCLVVCP